MLGDVGNFIGRHGELDPNSKTSGEVQTRQMTICLFREPLRIQGQPPQLDSRPESHGSGPQGERQPKRSEVQPWKGEKFHPPESALKKLPPLGGVGALSGPESGFLRSCSLGKAPTTRKRGELR